MDSNSKTPVEIIQTITAEDASCDLENQSTANDRSNTEESLNGTDDYWKWEIAGVFGSALALMGIIIFANHFDNKPTPSWSMSLAKYNKTFTVTMNSILSLLSTVAKICVLIPVTKGLGQLKWVWFAKKERSLRDIETFESASRGLTGSALLMWKLKFRHFAVVAALAMLISVVYDPFIQNLVSYSVRYPSEEELGLEPSATLSYATTYDVLQAGGSEIQLDAIMKSSLYSSIFDTSASWVTPDNYCGTGNCTWPNIASLAVCERCVDFDPYRNDLTLPQMNMTCDQDGCVASLPDGFSLGGPLNNSRNVMAMRPTDQPIVLTNFTNALGYVQSIFAIDPAAVDRFSQNITAYVPSNNSNIYAHECAMYACIQVINTTAATYSDGADKRNYNPITESILKEYTDFSVDESGNIVFPPIPQDDIKAMNITNGDSIFTMPATSVNLLGTVINRIFQGYVSTDTNSTSFLYDRDGIGDTDDSNSADYIQSIFFNSAHSNSNSGLCPWPGMSHWQAGVGGDVSCTVKNVAKGMSNGFRSAAWSGRESLSIPGSATHATSWVRVTWFWLFVPVLLWLLSLTILIGTALKTRRAGVRTWRTNPLPMVFLEMSDEQRRQVKNHDMTEQGLAQKAKALKVKLLLDNNQVRMVKSG